MPKVENNIVQNSQNLILENIDNNKKNTFSIMGISISGLDSSCINNLNLVLNVDLAAGKKKIRFKNKEALLDVRPNTKALIQIKLFKNINKLAIEQIKVSFEKKLIIKNPASSMSSNPNNLTNTIKDSLVDLKLKEVLIDQEGNVSVNSKIKILKLFNKKIKPLINPLKMPDLEEIFLSNLGISNDENSIDNLNLKNLLKDLGCLTSQAFFSLDVNGPVKDLFLNGNGVKIKGHQEMLKIFVKGAFDLDKEGGLSINIHKDYSHIQSSLGKTNFEADIYIPKIYNAKKKPINLSLKASITSEINDIFIEAATDKAITQMMPRTQKKDDKATESIVDDFNTSFGSKKLVATMGIDIKAALDPKMNISSMNGYAKMRTKFTDAFGLSKDRGIELSGKLYTDVTINKFSYHQGDAFIKSKGSAAFLIKPSRKIEEKFPGIKPFNTKYKFSTNSTAQAKIVPSSKGLTHFLYPVKNLEGHYERINNDLTKNNICEIGSKEYFEQIKRITGASIRNTQKVKLLIDGQASMPERIKLINEAKDFICFQTLVFKGDKSGLEYANALINASQRGVKIYGIIDSLGNIESFDELEHEHPIYKLLKENGIKFYLYNSFLEDGLRGLFKIVDQYPNVFGVMNAKNTKNIHQIIKFFQKIMEVIDSSETKDFDKSKKRELARAMHTLFGGKTEVSTQTAINEIREALESNRLDLNAILSAVKHLSDISYRWHEKYLVADGDKAIIGGMNIADEYLMGGSPEILNLKGKEQLAWRDTDVLLHGDGACDVYKNFRRNWFYLSNHRLEKGPKISHPSTGKQVAILQHRPMIDQDHNISNFLLYNLRTLSPGQRAWFETAYFLPRGVLKILQEELVSAAKRGVDVRILTNSEKTSDFGPLVESCIFDTRELIRAGAKVYHRNEGRMVHSKVSIFGDNLTLVGSWNFDNRSAFHDSEDACAIYDQELTKDMIATLEKDMYEDSYEVKLADIKNQPIANELKSAVMLLGAELF